MKTKKETNDYSDKNGAIQRLMAFVESKGRPSAIAKIIGMSDNIFSNMIKRDTKPSSEMMIALAEEYSDFDIHYILLGHQIPIVSELKKDLKEKEQEIVYHKAVASKLAFVGKTKGVSFNPLVDRPGFSELLGKSIMSGIIFGKRQN